MLKDTSAISLSEYFNKYREFYVDLVRRPVSMAYTISILRARINNGNFLRIDGKTLKVYRGAEIDII